MVAAMSLPAVSVLDRKYVDPSRFNPWVCHHSKRFDLAKPFELAGATIATDGRRLIRFEGLQSEPMECDRNVPPLAKLPWDAFRGGRWEKVPKQSVRAIDTGCHECLGLGWIGNVEYKTFDVRETPTAYRERWIEDNLVKFECYDRVDLLNHLDENSVRWTEDAWRGDSLCEACSGKGFLDVGQAVCIEGSCYDLESINAARVFGDIEYQQQDYCNGSSPYTCKLLLFRGAGFEGMIMPRSV
jgi:hypothetical protein